MILHRALATAPDLSTLTADRPATAGRTAEGVAAYFARPSRVRSIGLAGEPVPQGQWYWESFDRSAFNRTVARRGHSRPAFQTHSHVKGNPEPIGSVDVSIADDHLAFTMYLADTEAGREAAELVRVGALTSASIGFRPITGRRGEPINGEAHVIWTEVDLREISLVPSGFGAHAGAEVTSVRSAWSADAWQRENYDSLKRTVAVEQKLVDCGAADDRVLVRAKAQLDAIHRARALHRERDLTKVIAKGDGALAADARQRLRDLEDAEPTLRRFGIG